MKSSAKWCEDIETYRTIKSAFVIEGNILDLQSWVNDDGFSNLTILDQYLHMYFEEVGYKDIIFFNRVDGFYNHVVQDDEMLKSFLKVAGIQQSHDTKVPSVASAMDGVRRAVKNYVESCVIILNMSSLLTTNPERMDHSEMEYFATLLLAMQENSKAPSRTENEYLNNLFIMIVNKANDLPAWIYLNNPYIKVVTINKPGREERKNLIKGHQYDAVGIGSMTADELEKSEKNLIAITDGFSSMEIDRLMQLCHEKRQKYSEYYKVINAYRYGVQEDPWGNLLKSDIRRIQENLEEYVKGQPAAIRAASNVVKRAATGLSGLQHSGSRPKGVLFFAGPTGTGKTELAKALARTIFGNESALLRFDMSEYSHEHSDQRLMGAPPGYVGYDAGGELTNAVKQHPFSILLFDEIEKAHPTILDKFLQILDDGRMTDSKGETVYFSETLLVFTSNKGMYEVGPNGERVSLVSETNDYSTIERTISSAIRDYFILDLGRPEILNRIGNNLIVFDFIRPDAVPQILEKQISNILDGIQENHNIRVNISRGGKAWARLMEQAVQNLAFGGRGIGNAVEKFLLNPLGHCIADLNWRAGEQYEITDLLIQDQSANIIFEKINSVESVP